MRNYIESLIEKKIAKADLTLDLQGSDQKMLRLACKDFNNYMKFQNNSSYRIELDQLEKISQKESLELEAFLSVWVAKWLKKWQERVKLLIGTKKSESSEDTKNLKNPEPIGKTLERKTELIEIAQSTLINKGEICASELLAEHILKTELTNNALDISDKGQAIIFLCNLLHKVNEISKNNCPLLFVEVNKSYYTS